jgi:predicted PurR-regulated permease PerM
MPRIASFIVLVAILLLMGGLFFHVIAGFLLPLFLALVLVVIFRPLYLRITHWLKGRNRIAAVATTLAVLLTVLIPLSLLIGLAGFEAVSVITDLGQDGFGPRLSELRASLGLAVPDEVQKIDKQAAQLADPVLLEDPQSLVVSLQQDLSEVTAPWLAQPLAAAATESNASAVRNLRRGLLEFNELADQLQRQLKAPDYPGREADIDATLLALHDGYYDVVRPRLIELVISQPQQVTGRFGSRFDAWLITQANPSRRKMEEMRRQLLESISPGSLGGVAVSTGKSVGSFLVSTLFGLIVMTVSIYYFLADGPAMTKALMRLSPLDPHYVDQLLSEFERVSRAVVTATLLSALAQGILAGIGYFVTGLEALFLLTVATMFLAMVPFFGATAVWLPCSLWLAFYENRIGAGIGLAIYGALIVSTVDNVIKPLILHGQSNLHPLLALLSVLGGVRALGPIGVFVGPMAVAFLQALANMVRVELSVLGQSPPVGSGATSIVATAAPAAATSSGESKA